MTYELTNHEFSEKDPIFAKACTLAKIPTSSRQASKYRRKRGLAFDMRKEAIHLSQVAIEPKGEEPKEGETNG